MSFIPTKIQSKTIDKFEKFVIDDHQCFIIKGYAGTGKTTLVKYFVNYLINNNKPFKLLAPTGRAAKVLSEKTGYEAYTVHRTIFSFNDILEEESAEKDDPVFYFGFSLNQDPIETIYFIDEASMLSDVYSQSDFIRFGSGYLLKDLFEYVNTEKRKIVFIGDPAQLPPVGSIKSIALDKDDLLAKYNQKIMSITLKEVVRQKEESGIILNSKWLRKSIKSGLYNKYKMEITNTDVKLIESGSLDKNFKYNLKKNIDEKQVLITYTNADVSRFNSIIRENIFPGKNEIQLNDRLMIVKNNYGTSVELLNGTFAKVLDINDNVERRTVSLKRKDKDDLKVNLSFRSVVLGLCNHEGNFVNIKTLIFEDLLYNNQPNLSDDENRALIVDFSQRHTGLKRGSDLFKQVLKDDNYFNCVQAKFGYAITCYKAQGGEWKKPIVYFSNNKNILNEHFFRYSYTAITRAEKKIFLINPPEISMFSKQLNNDKDKSSNQLEEKEEEITISTKIPNRFSLETPITQEIYKGVEERLNSNQKILSIEHMPYRERYLIEEDEIELKIDFVYNNKNKITNIQPKGKNEELIKELNSLKGLHLTTSSNVISPDNSKRNQISVDIKNNLETILLKKDIVIDSVEYLGEWQDRYHVHQSKKKAEFEIFFNKKGQPTPNSQGFIGDGGLVNQIKKIILK